jgi:RNA polymerase sigma-70 factor (ECF subfamily)
MWSRCTGDQRVKEIVEAYVDAWMRRDVDALLLLLAEDAVFSMPPWASWWSGRDAIAAMLRAGVETCPEARPVPTWANGQPAMAYYVLDTVTGRYLPGALDVYTFNGDSITDITGFVMPGLFAHFGLPAELAP